MRDSKWGFPIIDFHCHFPAEDNLMSHSDSAYIAKHGEQKFERLRTDWRWYQEQWWETYGFEPPEDAEPPLEKQIERWANEADRVSLERVVFVTGGGNDTLGRIVAAKPERFIGFAHHDPFSPKAEDELRRSVVKLGLRGYKILVPALRGSINDESLFPLWQVVEDLGIPLLIHFGQLNGGGGIGFHQNINPLVLHDVAKAFPKVPFVIPHFGCAYPGELLQLAWSCRNVYVDTSGNNEWVRWMPYSLTVADLFRKFVDTVGPHRIIFGSDSSHFPRGLVDDYYETQIDICSSLGLTPTEQEQIFSLNAAQLLGIDPTGHPR